MYLADSSPLADLPAEASTAPQAEKEVNRIGSLARQGQVLRPIGTGSSAGKVYTFWVGADRTFIRSNSLKFAFSQG